ncbi:bifunctional oligoribonuclease/PAP phosphatase NrnA [Halonotius aquaticus]|uniref:Bifunctional oligoribonuclease/PAP phosphatase NrnA n=1 Tax=Halonotius aquaticus TaxID=2216978 RepID=A0A3A6PQE6_9EURY|nr:bifunctional oligoribonuclease/PAP phosphatase NrnA [Halonotius aquaticus]RJX43892.1 bifunctional oligoribonuclease/PAP phosphatase NrnA [Halonotius aquaticus]
MSSVHDLHHLLADGSELNIVCHNNPDPDCLASALALGRIAADAGIDERNILYSGDISHQENRAFVNLLEIDLKPFDAAALQERSEDSLVAFVDHSTPGANNNVLPETAIDIVIDHHPAEDIDARFVDHREELGAAATILAEYVEALDMEVEDMLATALLFAIRRETLNFLRGATAAEYDAAGFLHDHADLDLLQTLSTPSVSGATLDAIATAITNRTTTSAVLISHVGRTSERDAVPQAADYLATLEGVETVIVFGIIDESIHLSARSPDPRIHVGDVLRKTFADVGSAGGHHDVAGGEIPLGLFADFTTNDDSLLEIVEQVITARLLAELDL